MCEQGVSTLLVPFSFRLISRFLELNFSTGSDGEKYRPKLEAAMVNAIFGNRFRENLVGTFRGRNFAEIYGERVKTCGFALQFGMKIADDSKIK